MVTTSVLSGNGSVLFELDPSAESAEAEEDAGVSTMDAKGCCDEPETSSKLVDDDDDDDDADAEDDGSSGIGGAPACIVMRRMA